MWSLKLSKLIYGVIMLFLDDTQVLDFPSEVSADMRSLMEEIWREHFVPVARELVNKLTSTDLVPL